MPVTFSPAKHPANSVPPSVPGTSLDLLKANGHTRSKEILQSSFGGDVAVIRNQNGFVSTVVDAYNKHHALSIRPDDVWMAILVQFNLFVNGNAERLRSHFVAHEGKKELEVRAVGTRYTVDFGSLALQFTTLLGQNIKDPALCDWVTPDFTTTSDNDRVVATVIMMATLKEYFSYKMMLMCGLPRVTLEGERKDWEKLVNRLEKLKEFGEETTAWYHLLLPVLSRFVLAFDNPEGQDNLDFWGRIVHYKKSGSGSDYFSGWITAFCVFDEKGGWIARSQDENSKRSDPYRLALDGIHYHLISTDKLQGSVVEVDVKLDDNGELFDTIMVAGLVGKSVNDSDDLELSATGKRDVVKPVAGWWIYITED
ncbi:hypothetical protein C8J56DRAFT_958341 [Mycena floridula]|nr:hypothetical protein C8J56DRAFT_958341 [Mycena floridula]